jgi:hypothetical protein
MHVDDQVRAERPPRICSHAVDFVSPCSQHRWPRRVSGSRSAATPLLKHHRVLRHLNRVDRREQDGDAGDRCEQQDDVESSRLAWPHVLSPLPAEVLGDAVADRQPGLTGGAESRREQPTNTNARPSFPRATATGRPTWPSVSTETPAGEQDQIGRCGDREGEHAAERKPTNTLARMIRRSVLSQCSSTPPEEKKNTSYGVIAAPKGPPRNRSTSGCLRLREPTAGLPAPTAIPSRDSAARQRPQRRPRSAPAG